MREIVLTQGKVALVDDEDYEFLNQFKWLYHNKGYADRNLPRVNSKQKRQSMHRLINNTPEGFETDHIDGNKLNNQRSNLRMATPSQNQWNTNKRINNTSGFKGVSWHKGTKKWQAKINFKGKRKYLGLFDTPEAASQAYESKAKELFAEFYRKI